METNPALHAVHSPSDMVILVTMHLKIAESSGLMNLCYPFAFLNRFFPA